MTSRRRVGIASRYGERLPHGSLLTLLQITALTDASSSEGSFLNAGFSVGSSQPDLTDRDLTMYATRAKQISGCTSGFPSLADQRSDLAGATCRALNSAVAYLWPRGRLVRSALTPWSGSHGAEPRRRILS